MKTSNSLTRFRGWRDLGEAIRLMVDRHSESRLARTKKWGTKRHSSFVVWPDGHFFIEVYLQRKSANGQAEWWINGVSQGTITGIDNYNLFPTMDSIRLGESASRPASASGTAYWDDLVIRDDSTVIGMASYHVRTEPLTYTGENRWKIPINSKPYPFPTQESEASCGASSS